MATDIQLDYLLPEIDSRIIDVFQLEVDCIELEFRTFIHYDILHDKNENKIELILKHPHQNSLYTNPGAREIILFKLKTFLKIIVESYHN